MDKEKRGLIRNFIDVDHADSEELISRLDLLQTLDFFQNFKRESFERMGAGPGKHLADIGCGPGDDVRKLAGLVGETGSVVGFDVSESMVEEAKARHAEASLPISFKQSPAHNLACPDQSFDGVRSDRLYLYLDHPLAALAEAKRVVKPGGRVVVVEPDLEGVWFDNSLCSTTRKMIHALSDSVPNGRVGCQLYRLFRDVGLENIRLDLCPWVTADWALFDKIFHFRGIAEAAIAEGELTEAESDQWFGEMEERKRADRILGGLTLFLVVGQKPQ